MPAIYEDREGCVSYIICTIMPNGGPRTEDLSTRSLLLIRLSRHHPQAIVYRLGQKAAAQSLFGQVHLPHRVIPAAALNMTGSTHMGVILQNSCRN